MLRPAPLTALAFITLLAAGCKEAEPIVAPLSAQDLAIKSASAGSAATSQVVESGNAYIAAQITSNGTVSAFAEAPTTRAAKVASGTFLVTIENLLNPDGTPILPNTTGQFHLTIDGGSVTSWPTGATINGLHTVAVAFDVTSAPVTYTDPTSGLKSVIDSGTLTWTLASTYAQTAAQNWTLTQDTLSQIPVATPLTVSVTPTGKAAVVHTVSGSRKATTTIQRQKTASVNTLSWHRTVFGDVPNPVAVDGNQYSDWLITASGHQVRWSRHADFTFTWDFTLLRSTQVSASDAVYLTYDGLAPLGPFTPAQITARWGVSRNDAAW